MTNSKAERRGAMSTLSSLTGPGRAAGGFSMVELLIAIFITGVIATAIYSVYNSYFRQSNIQEMKLEAQQNARVAINLMERELMNAGYAAGTSDIITEAETDSIEFIYTDPETDSSISATAGQRLQVRYALQTVGGVQYLVRKADNLTTSTTGSTEQIIPYAQGLTFTYYDIDGDTITPSTQADRNTIRFVSVNMVTETENVIPGTSSRDTYMVETHIRLRNIGIGQTALDTSAPAAPTSLEVRDPGLCSRLKAKWDLNSEGDVGGYKLYYGTSSGGYTGVINVPLTVLSASTYSCSEVGTTMECTISPSAPALDYTASNAGSATTYYLAVKAYDNSLNHSGFSSEVSGNPDPSNSTFGSGSDDSTINPVKPPAATGFTAADGTGDNEVDLSWAAYDTSANPDVSGFRVYRSSSAFSSYPVDPSAADIDWIAGEPGTGRPTELDPTDTGFTDTGPGLIGCKTYYYAIAPVNCDATLVTDDGGDPAEEKYVQTDYDATCGDGTNPCTPGTGFSSVAGSDTSPAETTSPSAPSSFSVRAGWKRVAVSFTQPSDSDIKQTCIYSEEGSSYPTLQGTLDAAGCYEVDSPGIRLYESDGYWTTSELAPGTSTSFWHNSMSSLTSTPSLLETGTYSYGAVAFDLCGNSSNVTAAQATTTLCGEDPAGKPPAATGLSGSVCKTPVGLEWTGVSSDISQASGVNNPWDLAGYRVFRSTSSSDWTGATLLNTAAPWWGTGSVSFSDSTATEGGTYYYRVVTTDCPYEKINPNEATIRSDMISGTLNSTQTGPVDPGMLDRDEKCPGVGSCTRDDHREVLTGVDINDSTGNGTGESTVDTDYTHERVTMFLNNTSAGTMTVTGVSVSWLSSSAILDKVTIGGGRSGVGEVTTDLSSGLTTGVSGNPPYTSAVSGAAITAVQINAGARYVPITFDFEDSSGDPVDMRDDQLLVTLDVTNDSTSNTTCESYLTVSMSSEGIAVPFGPSVTATQQDQPASPTFGYAVPGATGSNTVPSGSNGSVVVDSGFTVTVSTTIKGNTTDASTGTKVPVSSATLFYKATAKTVTTAPTTGFTSVAMTNTAGSTWTADIPANDGFRVWYYIVADDDDGNFDRDPEVDEGAYVFDQKTFDVCNVTPSAPTGVTASVSGSDATVSWNDVTTYTNGATIDTSADSIEYTLFRDGSQLATGLSTTSYTDAGLADGVYAYTVKAYNDCPNTSDASEVGAACVGTSGQFTISASPSSIFRGDSYNVNITDCLAVNGAYATTVETINVDASFTGFSNTSGSGTYNPSITETGAATGEFPITIETTDDVSASGKLLVGETDTITVEYAPPSVTAQSVTVDVVANPCDTTPKAPASLSGSETGQNVTLDWSAVTLNTDDSSITDLDGYRVYEKVCPQNDPNCTGSDIIADWFVRTTAGSGTTSVTLSADQGNLNQREYHFKVTAIDTCSPTENESADSSIYTDGR